MIITASQGGVTIRVTLPDPVTPATLDRERQVAAHRAEQLSPPTQAERQRRKREELESESLWEEAVEA